MNLSISELSHLLKLALPLEEKSLLKSLSIEVIRSLSPTEYLVQSATNKFQIQSDFLLDLGEKYWTQLELKKDELPKLIKLIHQPSLFKKLHQLNIFFDVNELHKIFSNKNPFEKLKHTLLYHLSNAQTKEEFNALSNLLTPMMHNILTIPLQSPHALGFFQMKKRYNKKRKESVIDFYAALPHLGPVSGVIYMIETEIFIDIQVAFETTQKYLQEHLTTLRYKTSIVLKEKIEPLYHPQSDSLLDISI